MRRALWLGLALLCFQPAAYAADAARGKLIAEVRCTPCHHLDSTTFQVGPGLLDIYGKKPTISGVPFRHWDAEALDAWLANPRGIKPNTKMSIPRISKTDRADLIAFFKSQSARN
ncbi:MAG TPA: c-type cytochrome [Mariprofundaceae bacterium]|nr:c-type cytochrome [Mariprofundaceae bacterium]